MFVPQVSQFLVVDSAKLELQNSETLTNKLCLNCYLKIDHIGDVFHLSSV